MAKRLSRAQRFEQVEAFLASDMKVSEWCSLNHVSPPTLYRWLDIYAQSECPDRVAELRPNKAKGQWIELRQAHARNSVAIVAADSAGAAPAAGPAVGATVTGAEPVTVSMAGATLTVTAATDPAALRLALGTLASL